MVCLESGKCCLCSYRNLGVLRFLQPQGVVSLVLLGLSSLSSLDPVEVDPRFLLAGGRCWRSFDESRWVLGSTHAPINTSRARRVGGRISHLRSCSNHINRGSFTTPTPFSGSTRLVRPIGDEAEQHGTNKPMWNRERTSCHLHRRMGTEENGRLEVKGELGH